MVVAMQWSVLKYSRMFLKCFFSCTTSSTSVLNTYGTLCCFLREDVRSVQDQLLKYRQSKHYLHATELLKNTGTYHCMHHWVLSQE